MDHPGTQMRASDRERQATVRALRGQMSDGRLSELTFVRRLDMALVDMCIDHISVSRRHAVLTHLDGAWVLSDLGSRNGTWVNGWRLPGPAPIEVGDLVELGSRRFVVVDRPHLQIVDS